MKCKTCDQFTFDKNLRHWECVHSVIRYQFSWRRTIKHLQIRRNGRKKRESLGVRCTFNPFISSWLHENRKKKILQNRNSVKWSAFTYSLIVSYGWEFFVISLTQHRWNWAAALFFSVSFDIGSLFRSIIITIIIIVLQLIGVNTVRISIRNTETKLFF